MSSFPKTIAERLEWSLNQHGLKDTHTLHGGVYKCFNNAISPMLGTFIYVGPKGSLRVGDSIGKSIPSPVLKERLLREFHAHLTRSNYKVV